MARIRTSPWAVLVVASAGTFMTLVDLTVINIAVPSLTGGLHASLSQALWVINGYTIALTVLLITAGRVGDRYGPRTVFIVGVLVFTAASAACGTAGDAGELIALRVVQGAGAAALLPQTLAIITTIFPRERLGSALGVWATVAGVAAVAGPTVGGLLITWLGWRWIFFINVPVGTAVVVASLAVIPDVRPGAKRRIDLGGVVLATLALLAVCFCLVEGQQYDWGHIAGFVSIPLIGVASVVLLLAFGWQQRRAQQAEPLVPFALLRERGYSLMNFVAWAVNAAMAGFLLTLSIYLQSVDGMSALRAGLTMVPAAIMSMLAAPAAGPLTDRLGGKFLVFGGLLMLSGGLAWVTAIAGQTSGSVTFVLPFAIAGTGIGVLMTAMTTIAMRGVPQRFAGAASGLFNTNRQLGAVIGATAAGALLLSRLAATLPGTAVRDAAALPGRIRPTFIASFRGFAASGLEVGSGSVRPPAGVPPGMVKIVAASDHLVLAQSFIAAMRVAMIFPVVVTAAAALCCLALREGTTVHSAGGSPQPAVQGQREGYQQGQAPGPVSG
jgi:EmrB/QacA subfamily drug resistance transporter